VARRENVTRPFSYRVEGGGAFSLAGGRSKLLLQLKDSEIFSLR
jgi:hypothetical protein